MSGNTGKIVNTGNKDSKFRLILLAAKRARQIQSGAKPLVHTMARKPTRIAQEELKAGVLPFEVIAVEKRDVGSNVGSHEETSKSKR